MERHWREADGRPTVGAFRQPSVSIGQYTPSNLETLIQETDDQERAARVFGVCCCASPFVLAVIFWAVIKLFS